MMIYSAPKRATAKLSVAATSTNHIAPIHSTVSTLLWALKRLSLPLLFCSLLIGCDAQSSSGNTFNSSANDKKTSGTMLQTPPAEDVSIDERQDNEDVVENENDSHADGQSLIAIAKTNDKARSSRATIMADDNTSSTLQATLIGDYTGMLPCSFCDGIEVTLNLFSDGSVLKTRIYENPETPTLPLTESGVYRQDDNTIIIVYEDKKLESYRIQNNHLLMLDENKNADSDYTLSRK